MATTERALPRSVTEAITTYRNALWRGENTRAGEARTALESVIADELTGAREQREAADREAVEIITAAVPPDRAALVAWLGEVAKVADEMVTVEHRNFPEPEPSEDVLYWMNEARMARACMEALGA